MMIQLAQKQKNEKKNGPAGLWCTNILNSVWSMANMNVSYVFSEVMITWASNCFACYLSRLIEP